MTYEVEQKFRVEDPRAVADRISAIGGVRGEPMNQVDVYFSHPARDFAQTDEALRLRQVGETNLVTYKGPKLDKLTKTRREIELPLSDGSLSFKQWCELLMALGFKQVLKVEKRRTPYCFYAGHRGVEIVLDQVEDLGWFVEIEKLADSHQLDAARDEIAQIAAQLELSDLEQRSYLELLLSSRQA